MVESLFQSQREFLVSSCRGAMPSAGCGPSQAATINLIQHFAKKNVGLEIGALILCLQSSSFFYHHLCYISDTIGALGWVVISPYPAKVTCCIIQKYTFAQFIRDQYEFGHKHVKVILSRDRPFHRDTFTKVT